MLLAGCFIQREPKADDEGYEAGALPANYAENQSVGGLSCGVDGACPFTIEGLLQCCTDGLDVGERRAQATDRCGIDFAGRDPAVAGQCWQRDQPGVPFPACPSEFPSFAVREEEGCCALSGVCGSRNTFDALDCHENVGKAEPCGLVVDESVDCEATGTFANRAEVDVYWGGRTGGTAALTDDGRGTITITLLSVLDQKTGELTVEGHTRSCGVRLPPFYSSTLCETYDAIFPDSIWDSPEVPAFTMRAEYQCLHPGCILATEPTVGLVGIDMLNPEALWPSAAETTGLACVDGQGMPCYPDVDLDGYPAATLIIRTDGAVPPPVGTNTMCAGFNRRAAPLSEDLNALFDLSGTGDGVRRADRLFLGTRTKLGGSGVISADCKTGVGSGLAEFVQSRAWSCLLKPGSGANGFTNPAGPEDDCSPAEARFMDENLPIYRILKQGETPDPNFAIAQHASKGPIFRMVRLGPADMIATCADARNAAFPADPPSTSP